MSIESFYTTPVTIITPGVQTDRRGNRVPDWETATTAIDVGWLAQLGSSEELDGRDAQISSWSLTLRPEAVITARCRVTDGVSMFEVDGIPQVANTRNGPHHQRVQLRLIDEPVLS